MKRITASGLLAAAAVLAGVHPTTTSAQNQSAQGQSAQNRSTESQSAENPSDRNGETSLRMHYLEVVAENVEAQIETLEAVHGVSFGPQQADLGDARVAEIDDGTLLGVRAPMAEHEQPIVRTYLEVQDIEEAVEAARAAGATIAYGPTQQGDTGTWAIYILGDVQFGLWQR